MGRSVFAWLGGAGAVAVLMGFVWVRNRGRKRRARFDVGTVSQRWVAQHRAQPADSFDNPME